MKKLYLIFLAIFIAGFSFSQSKTTVTQSSAIPLSMQASPQSNELLLKSAMIESPQDLSNIKDVVYLRTGTCGNYWDQNGNATALDNTFGAGNWTRLNFEGLDVPALLATNVKFIFIDGSNYGTCEFITFLNSYRTELEAWVFLGGSLFLNAAPNECYSSPIELIANDTLAFQGSDTGTSADNSHPIFLGPKTPAIATTYNGDSFSHTYVYGEGLVPVLLNNASNPILAEKKFGYGTIMFGGLTLEFFGQHAYWSPEPQISNLYSNILQYMYDAASFCIDDITQDNDAGECGAVVHYDYPAIWAAATVTQIDGTGLSSDSLFPVGVTTQSYQLVWDGGSGPTVIGEKSATITGPLPPTDTCTFTITVVDTTPPVVTCHDTVLYASANECGAEIKFQTEGKTIGIAEEGITIPFAIGYGYISGVAFNPNTKLYYAVRAGSSGYPLKTFDENGIEQHSVSAGFDFRGLWWNPNSSKLEGNSYGGHGYRSVDLDANDYALSTGTTSPANNYQPSDQSEGDYDFDADEVIIIITNFIEQVVQQVHYWVTLQSPIFLLVQSVTLLLDTQESQVKNLWFTIITLKKFTLSTNQQEHIQHQFNSRRRHLPPTI